MSKIAFVGDTHANGRRLDAIIGAVAAKEIPYIVQVGDFGFWPRDPLGERFLDQISETATYEGVQIHWVDGNHEDHQELPHDQEEPWVVRENVIWHPRGTVTELYGKTFLWLGGAVSVDKNDRTPGHDWFFNETPNYGQWERAIRAGKVDVMVCHDGPSGSSYRGMPKHWIPVDLQRASREMRDRLEMVRQVAQPSLVVHGHWHERKMTILPSHTILALGHDYGSITDQVAIINTDQISDESRVVVEWSVDVSEVPWDRSRSQIVE